MATRFHLPTKVEVNRRVAQDAGYNSYLAYSLSSNIGRENKKLSKRIDKAQERLELYESSTTYSDIETRQNFQTYPYDYYCGTNAKVFFGDIWVDDVVTIQYNVKQDKEPIYGYASQNFDAVARGIVLVQGSFTIAFKEMGYLNIVQAMLEAQRSRASKRLIEQKIATYAGAAETGFERINPGLLRSTTEGTGYTYAPNGTAQIIRQQQTIEDILKYMKGSINPFASGVGAQIFNFGGSEKERDFEDFAELLEDTIWGDSNGKPYSPSVKFRRADEFDYTWERGGRDLGGVIVGSKSGDYSQTLNILITFGDINDYRAEHTMVVLNDVHIVSSSMIVAPTGEPIAETYYFFARDINQALSTDTIKSLPPIKYSIGDTDLFTGRDLDISEIEKFLNGRSTSNLTLSITSIARYNDDLGIWELDKSFKYTLDYLVLNAWDSKLDQVIKKTEQVINQVSEYSISGQDSMHSANSKLTNYSQWIMNAVLSEANGANKVEFKMVLEQQIPYTLTYRVISPTRNNFSSIAAFTREDLWSPVPASPAGIGEKEPERKLPKTSSKVSAQPETSSANAAEAEPPTPASMSTTIGEDGTETTTVKDANGNIIYIKSIIPDGPKMESSKTEPTEPGPETWKATSGFPTGPEPYTEMYTTDSTATRMPSDPATSAMKEGNSSLGKKVIDFAINKTGIGQAFDNTAGKVVQSIFSKASNELQKGIEGAANEALETVRSDTKKVTEGISSEINNNLNLLNKLAPIQSRSNEDLQNTVRSVSYMPYLSESHVPKGQIVPLIVVESSGDPNAKSGKGAVGITQVTPNALKDVNKMLKTSYTMSQISADTALNIKVGSAYYASVLSQVKRDPELMAYAREHGISPEAVAAGAYNAGVEGLRKMIRYGTLPVETRKQMGNYDIAQYYYKTLNQG